MADLTGKQVRAADLVAEDEKSDEDIAREVGIHVATLERWKQRAEFQARVRELIDELAANLQRYHIARKDKRVAAMDKRWRALDRVMDERAADLDGEAPGGGTGMIVREYQGKDTDVRVYPADTALSAEMRALEKQAAQELGQWSEKNEISGPGNGPIDVTIVFDRADPV